MKVIKSLFLTLAILFCLEIQNSYALHIIGGEVVYECVGINAAQNQVTFHITFTMYRDSKSNGADFDSPTDFGIYRGNGNQWTYVRTITNIRVRNVSDIDISTENPCILIPTNVGVQRGVYEFDVTLPIIDESYVISYQRCCRNDAIFNILDPGGTGAAFTTEITPEAQRVCNNSPSFNKFPPVVICVNSPINFDHSATDMDGDSLVYEFCSPLTAGGQDGSTVPGDPTSCTGVTPNPFRCPPPYDEVTYNLPDYNYDRPMGGDPLVYIDDMTGFIGGAPNVLGRYVVGVCVKEYRDGELLSSLRRDFQFNVTTCEQAVKADISASKKDGSDYTINSCGDYTINFKNLSTDVRFIKNYSWEFDINGEIETYDSRDVSVTFPGVGQYTATMILNKDIPNAEDCTDTANITINLYPSINADFTFEYDTCKAGPVVFTDFSESGAGPVRKWDWNFIEGSSDKRNPEFEYEFPGNKTARLIVEDDNKCRDTLIQTIPYFPVPHTLIVDPNVFTGCQPAHITFNNLSDPIDESYTFEWDFGDGNQGDVLNPTHVYEESGVYDVKLKVISPLGCVIEKGWSKLIEVLDSPVAGFSFSPEEPNLFDNTVHFIDESTGGNFYQWTFDTLGLSLMQNPTFTFRDTGTFLVQQVVLRETGCTDTSSVLIPILPFINFFMPNAFTPDGDGLNDVFIPVGSFEGVSFYNFSIWNRWGDKLFETTDFGTGWNGQRNNTGNQAPPGVYAYIIKYKDGHGNIQVKKGHCTLIR